MVSKRVFLGEWYLPTNVSGKRKIENLVENKSFTVDFNGVYEFLHEIDMKTLSSWTDNCSFKWSLESKTMPPKSVKRHSAIGLSTTCLAWHSKASVLQHQLLCGSTKIHSIVDVRLLHSNRRFFNNNNIPPTRKKPEIRPIFRVLDFNFGFDWKNFYFSFMIYRTMVFWGTFHVKERGNHRFLRELRCAWNDNPGRADQWSLA